MHSSPLTKCVCETVQELIIGYVGSFFQVVDEFRHPAFSSALVKGRKHEDTCLRICIPIRRLYVIAITVRVSVRISVRVSVGETISMAVHDIGPIGVGKYMAVSIGMTTGRVLAPWSDLSYGIEGKRRFSRDMSGIKTAAIEVILGAIDDDVGVCPTVSKAVY
jgi:hypothetical protein